MKKLFSLGELYVSDFLKEGEYPRGGKVEMKLMMTDNGNVRLEKSADLNTMYGKYWYRSSINTSMLNELKNIVQSIMSIYKLRENEVWCDIACNDGGLLSFVPKNLIRVGVDPSDDSFRIESEKHANFIIQDFFKAEDFKKLNIGKAKVITCIAMFYDLEHPDQFLQDINEIMDDDGLFVLQLSYTPLMIEQLAFDNLCHEHLYYYSLFNIKSLFEKNGLQIMDCQLNDTNSGSFRIYCMKQKANIKKFSSQPYRDVCSFRIKSLLEYEKTLNLDKVETWIKFYDRINDLKEKVVNFIKTEKSKGKVILAYGASTKGNSLLQYFGLDNTLITAIAERSIYKWGLRTVGTNIPIISEDEFRKYPANNTLALVLPYHFINEFIERESEFLQKGGKFIVPAPKFEIIGL